ncbi:hypothetical protein C8R43DRAFT_1106579 [Mycena crocata]|nr:hypothetical protein C8R43DRAFT_1106579 [Mycena crocata]
MKFLAYCITTVGPLAALAPLLSSFAPVSAITVFPRADSGKPAGNASTILEALDESQIPQECLSPCQPILAGRSTCGIDLTCLCTDPMLNNLAQCLDCALTTSFSDKFTGGTLMDAYTTSCANNKLPIASLSLSLTRSAASSSGLAASGIATSAPATSHPVASGPTASGPAASNPAASGPSASSTGTVTQAQTNGAGNVVHLHIQVIAVLQFFFIFVGLLVTGVAVSI